MTSNPVGRTRRSVLTFTIILVVFLIVADGLIIAQQNKMLRTAMTTNTEHEFDLFNKLVVGSLIKGDYVAVQEAVYRWGEEQSNIIELSITTANRFIVAEFKRDIPSAYTERFKKSFEFGFNNMVTIVMVKDMSALSAAVERLAYQLFLFSIILVGVLGFLLQRMALRPLRTEIIEHEQTEGKLRQQAIELQESNKELESYSYSIAHDLRAPLRSIISFSQILEEDAEFKLDSEEKESLKRIVVASKRMADLIDDILELGRITRSELQFVKLDLTALVNVALERLCGASENRQVEWQVQEGVTAVGDKRLISLAIDNLLDNACKYSGMKPRACIQFGATSISRKGNIILAYFVRDNGVGFDMQYAGNLFKPFHRLHNDESFEGTGVGLATVQRIVHRHGGEIWAEAEPNKGACFYFTLGKNV